MSSLGVRAVKRSLPTSWIALGVSASLVYTHAVLVRPHWPCHSPCCARVGQRPAVPAVVTCPWHVTGFVSRSLCYSPRATLGVPRKCVAVADTFVGCALCCAPVRPCRAHRTISARARLVVLLPPCHARCGVLAVPRWRCCARCATCVQHARLQGASCHARSAALTVLGTLCRACGVVLVRPDEDTLVVLRLWCRARCAARAMLRSVWHTACASRGVPRSVPRRGGTLGAMRALCHAYRAALTVLRSLCLSCHAALGMPRLLCRARVCYGALGARLPRSVPRLCWPTRGGVLAAPRRLGVRRARFYAQVLRSPCHARAACGALLCSALACLATALCALCCAPVLLRTSDLTVHTTTDS